MRQVSKSEFFKPIYEQGLDVHPSIVSEKFPYVSNWEFRRKFGRPLFGKTVDRVEGGLVVTDYFLSA